MEYKLDEKLHAPFNEYLENCIPFLEFQNELVCGDKFWKLYTNKIMELEFVEFVQCEWQDKITSSNVCGICKGKIKIRGNDLICTGATRTKSNVLRIVKRYKLEDSLFEI